MNRYFKSVRSAARDYLEQFSIASRTNVDARPLFPLDHPQRMPHCMFDVSGLDPMLEGRRVNFPHSFDSEGHATRRTSKLGIAMAPAPPIRARMRVT